MNETEIYTVRLPVLLNHLDNDLAFSLDGGWVVGKFWVGMSCRVNAIITWVMENLVYEGYSRKAMHKSNSKS